MGITRQLRDAMVTMDSISVEEANSLFYLIDKHGLIKQSLGQANIREDLQEFVRSDDEWAEVKENGAGEIGLLETVKKVKPTVLIGCSTHGGAFTEEVVKVFSLVVSMLDVSIRLSRRWRKGAIGPSFFRCPIRASKKLGLHIKSYTLTNTNEQARRGRPKGRQRLDARKSTAGDWKPLSPCEDAQRQGLCVRSVIPFLESYSPYSLKYCGVQQSVLPPFLVG